MLSFLDASWAVNGSRTKARVLYKKWSGPKLSFKSIFLRRNPTCPCPGASFARIRTPVCRCTRPNLPSSTGDYARAAGECCCFSVQIKQILAYAFPQLCYTTDNFDQAATDCRRYTYLTDLKACTIIAHSTKPNWVTKHATCGSWNQNSGKLSYETTPYMFFYNTTIKFE